MFKIEISEYQRQRPVIQLIPLVDILFFTLIFFMTTSVLQEMESELSITVPKSVESTDSAREPGEILINVDKTGGIVVAYKKGDINADLADARRAISLLGGELSQRHDVDVEGLRDRRCLIVLRKVRPTPPEYPRRPGVPQKSPL